MAKKHAKFKLPKRVAGVKIPKVIRKGPLPAFLNSGAGQLILAEMIVAIAAAFTAAKTDEDSPVGEGLRHPVEGARRVANAVIGAGADENERLAHAFRAAGVAFRDALQGRDEAWHDRLDSTDDPAPAKKKSSTRGLQH
jgi:hypothetical protein